MTTLLAEDSLLSGRYRVTAEIGRGGMSTVYRARDEALGRDVAVKVLTHGLTDGDGIARHREEVQLLASLNHPGLVMLFDAATDAEADCAFLVMELVEGEDLRHRLSSGPLLQSEVALIGRQLAEALAYTHARGVIHRDVKPGNVLLPRRDGEATGAAAKLADFGIARIVDGARLTATGTVLGTAGYFSPEQALGAPLTGASDMYSLGLVLLEALTGERAFPGSAAESMAARLHRDPAIPATLDPEWTELISRMVEREPQRRISELAAAERLTTLAARVPRETATAATEALDPTLALPPIDINTVPASAADVSTAAMTAPLAAPEPTAPAVSPGTTAPVSTAPVSSAAVSTAPDSAAVSTAAASASASSAAASAPRSRRRRMLVIAGAAAAVLIAIVTGIAVAQGTGPETAAPPAYPAVEGELGESLEQLQRSVEP